MITRRFFLYFLAATGIALGTTATYGFYTVHRISDEAVGQLMTTAQSAAGFVRAGLVEHEGDVLRRLLASLPEEVKETPEVLSQLRATRRLTVDETGVAIVDASRRVVAADLDRAGLPPASVLLSALRHAEERMVPVVTDIWDGRDGSPRVALIVGDSRAKKWRAAVAPINLGGEDFLRLFRYFSLEEEARLQLLDSTGVALFSTRSEEMYESVVHGTYFTDRARTGRPAVMECLHSCHQPPGKDREMGAEPVRDPEVTAIAPVAGTDWSVSVRESRSALFGPIREMAFTSVALASVLIGTFAGFFVLLSRRVLRPISRLVGVAAGMARGEESRAMTDGAYEEAEFATLAESLETLRFQRALAGRTEPPRPARPVRERGEGVSTAEICATLEQTLGPALEGIVRTPPIVSVAILMECDGTVRMVLRPEDSAFQGPEPLGVTLMDMGSGNPRISREDLEKEGIRVAGPARRFVVRSLEILEEMDCQMWIGLESAEAGPHIRPALDLMVAHAQNVATRGVLYDRLQRDRDQKGHMIRHLFESDDEERRRLAREIHDETAQVLSALRVVLERVPASEESIREARGYVDRLMEETDRLIHRLRPAVLDDLGLVEAVRTTGMNLLTSAGVEFHVDVEGEEMPLPPAVEATVYRVFQEAITNTLKHAQAGRVTARMEFRPDRLVASIQDDGRGMDLAWLDRAVERSRWGLLGMRERILQFDGRIEFTAPEGGGLRIDFEVPRSMS